MQLCLTCMHDSNRAKKRLRQRDARWDAGMLPDDGNNSMLCARLDNWI